MSTVSLKAALRLMIVAIIDKGVSRDTGIDAHREGRSRITLRIFEEICESRMRDIGIVQTNASSMM